MALSAGDAETAGTLAGDIADAFLKDVPGPDDSTDGSPTPRSVIAPMAQAIADAIVTFMQAAVNNGDLEA